MNKTLIVAYYNSLEFLDLVNVLEKEFSFIIYNKSGSQLKHSFENLNEVESQNIGREGYTYINHIINNYENLNDINVFIQNDFYNHLFSLDNFIENFNNNKHKEFYQFPLRVRKPEGILEIKRTVINGHVDFGMGNIDGVLRFSQEMNIPLPEIYETDVCANFIISKNRIHRYSKEKYEEILKWLVSNPINEWTLEHSWKFLFM